MPEYLNELLMQVLLAVAGFVAAAVGFYLRLYLVKIKVRVETEIGREQYAWLEDVVSGLVHAAAQNPAFREFTGAQLKDYVLDQAGAFVERNKLPFDREDIDALIEQAVSWLKVNAPVLTEGK